MSTQPKPGEIIEIPGFEGFWNIIEVTPNGIVVVSKP